MTWIGALGASSFNNEMEDISNGLASRINDTSNYVWTTSDIFVKEIEHTSNYVWTTSNILATRIKDTSNILATRINDTSNVLATRINDTSNILEARIKALEGSEGTAGDVNLGIPSIPSTGGVAVAAAIATITAACIGANGITVLTLLDILEDKVDLNKTQADKIGGWSSNYSDKVGVWSSDYTDKIGIYGSNYTDRVGIFGSNYTDKVGIWGSNYARDKIGVYSSNYTDKVGVWSSNYAYDKVGMYSSNYTDKVGVWSSNYAYDKVGMYSSNYTDKVGVWSSNYAYDKVGMYSSNYSDKVGIWSSNYAYDKVGMYSSNYNDKVGIWSSNYAYDKVGMYSSNYTDKVGVWSSNYAYDKVGMYSSNYSDKVGIWSSNYAYDKVGMYSSNYSDKVGVWGSNYTLRLDGHTSNYVASTSNNLVSRIMNEVGFGSNYTLRLDGHTSNYVARINTALSGANYWTTDGATNIYLNQTGNVGIGTNTPQNKLHIYNATSSALRLETATTGTSSIIFQRGTTNDIRTDYRIIHDTDDVLKFQYQDNLVNFGATTSDIMWVNDKGTKFIKNGHFSGNVGIGMYPDVSALSISGNTYMSGNLGINSIPGSYTLDLLGNVRIDGEVGIGPTGPISGVKLFVNGTTRLGSVGIGVAPSVSYGLDINGDTRTIGNVGIGTVPNASYKLDILGNFRTQGGIVTTGLIQAGNGITVSGQVLTASAGITVPAGQTLTSSGTLTANVINASGLITGNAGLTIPSGQTLTVNGSFAPSTLTVSGLITANGGITANSQVQLVPPVVALTLPSDLVSSPAYTTYVLPAVSNTVYKCAIFKYAGTGTSTTYSVTIPSGGLLCDVLMVGGGGCGGGDIGAGGGGGAVLYGTNIFIPEGVYSLVVGRGAITQQSEVRGQSTTGFGATILGGGSGGVSTWPTATTANTGGSGSGGKSAGSGGVAGVGGEVGLSTKGSILSDATLYNGNKGGSGVVMINQVSSGGGGGAGAVGVNGITSSGTSGTNTANGGAGVLANILDATPAHYWGGGGGSGSYGFVAGGANGGIGGGGSGGNGVGVTTNQSLGTNGFNTYDSFGAGYTGCPSSGGGGGGGGYGVSYTGGGGSGVIILKYRRTIEATRVVDYVKTGTPAITDYKVGMVNGDYKIQSIQSSIIRDRFTVSALSGSVGIGENALVIKSIGDVLINNNLGIGLEPSSTYKVNVNGSINSTALFVNGNVGIGTTNPTSRLQITHTSTSGNPDTGNTALYVYNPTNSAGQKSVITNRIAGSASDKAIYSFDVSAAHGYSIYLAGNNSALKFNNNWEGAGTDTMTLFNNGEAVISGSKFVIKGNSGGAPTLHLRHANNRTAFIHNNSDILYFLSGAVGGADTENNWGVVANGRWPLTINLNNNNATFGGDVNAVSLTSTSYITASSYILSNNSIISRNGYDATLYTDSAGMYMRFGDSGTGNSTYFELNAAGGATNINSNSSRPIYMRTNNQVWTFATTGYCFNPVNNGLWQVQSDHRIKEDIKKANLKMCYDNVKNINLYRFKYIDGFKEGTKHDKTQLGYVAQQVKQHFPKSVSRHKMRIEDKREIPDLSSVDLAQVNYSLFGAVKQLIRVVEKQSKRIKKLEEMLNMIDDDEVEDDADEPYTRVNCEDECDIDDIEPSEPEGV